jgi:hypothetical protein
MNTIFKTAGKNMLLDLPSNQLTFLDSRFYMCEDGTFVPSVTTILDCYPKSAAFYEWLKKEGENADEIRDEAGRRGSAVHKLTEDYDNGVEVTLLNENGFIAYKLIEWSMLTRYVEFRQRFKVEIIHNELNVVSPTLKVGGTIDRVMRIDTKNYLIDLKTSNNLSPHFWLQVAAYRKMLAEKNIIVDGVGILWLNAKTKTDGKPGTYQGKGYQLILKEDTEKDWQLFQATYRLWEAENGDLKPKTTSYQLKYKHDVAAVA